MVDFLGDKMKEKMMRNAGISEDKMVKYLKESKKPVVKPDSAKKIVEVKKTAKRETLEEMKSNFQKQMLKMIDEAFDTPREKDPLNPAAGDDLGLPPAGDAGLPPAGGDDLSLSPVEGESGMGDELGLGGKEGAGDDNVTSLQQEIKDRFSELAAKLGEEEKNAFANELMEILFPGSTTEISDEGELGDEEGVPPDEDELGDEELDDKELDDEDLL